MLKYQLNGDCYNMKICERELKYKDGFVKYIGSRGQGGEKQSMEKKYKIKRRKMEDIP